MYFWNNWQITFTNISQLQFEFSKLNIQNFINKRILFFSSVNKLKLQVISSFFRYVRSVIEWYFSSCTTLTNRFNKPKAYSFCSSIMFSRSPFKDGTKTNPITTNKLRSTLGDSNNEENNFLTLLIFRRSEKSKTKHKVIPFEICITWKDKYKQVNTWFINNNVNKLTLESYALV